MILPDRGSPLQAGNEEQRADAFAADARAKKCLGAGDLQGAADQWRQALALFAPGTEIRYNLARCLTDLGQVQEAEAVYADLIRAEPDHGDALYNLGNLCLRKGDAAGAVQWFRRAVAVDPDNQPPWLNLGLALKGAGRLQEAETVYREAIRRWPDWARLRWTLSLLLLSMGRWRDGFAEFQWRLGCFELPEVARTCPGWDGSPAKGRHLLLWAEQGVGDAIHFLRYVPMAATRVARITLCCHEGMMRLAATTKDLDRVLPFGAPLPPFDLQAPLMSLPHLLDCTEPEASWAGPYLQALSMPERERVPGPLRVGLVWSGNPEFANDRHRSLPPALLRCLADLPGLALYSLQKGGAAENAGREAFGGRIADLAPYLRDFADTADALARLDLVISVDTAVAHLAGAMGKPVWLLLPHIPDWRWQQRGKTTAWYPSMRLFRQTEPGDWPSVIQRVYCALAKVGDRQVPVPMTVSGEGGA